MTAAATSLGEQILAAIAEGDTIAPRIAIAVAQPERVVMRRLCGLERDGKVKRTGWKPFAGKQRPVYALEASSPVTTVRHVDDGHQDHAPRPLVTLDPEDLDSAAQAIRGEVRRLQRLGAASYLYVDEQHQVFVVSELRSVAQLWAKQHDGWLVAVYQARRSNGSKRNDDGTPFLTATIEGITEDLQAHLADLSRPKP